MPLIFAGRTVTLSSQAGDGESLPAEFMGIGASDGSLLQALLVESATNPNLRVTLYGSGNPLSFGSNVVDGFTNAVTTLVVRTMSLEFNGATWDRIRHKFVQTVTGINSNGAGTTLDMHNTPMSKFTMQVDLTAGSSAYVVDIEGSLDGTDWISLGTLSSSDDPDMLHIVNKPVSFIRYNVTTIGAGNTMTIDLLATGR